GTIAHRIDLHGARNHALLLALDVQHVERGEEVAGLDLTLQRMALDRHVLRLAFAAIENARDETLLAGLVGRALAGAFTRFRFQILHLAHSRKSLFFQRFLWPRQS